jgi:hypothetical protein
MAPSVADSLTAERAWIFRITHRDNVRAILENGLRCSQDPLRDAAFVSIGDKDLIGKRATRVLPILLGGTLADYIPFYFTPFSPMALKIKNGKGVNQVESADLVILFSSLEMLESHGVAYLFTDRHAYMQTARFFASRTDLHRVDFEILRRRDFKATSEDPEKIERYMAEALVHRFLPVSALLGLACYTAGVQRELAQLANQLSSQLKIVARPGWFF